MTIEYENDEQREKNSGTWKLTLSCWGRLPPIKFYKKRAWGWSLKLGQN